MIQMAGVDSESESKRRLEQSVEQCCRVWAPGEGDQNRRIQRLWLQSLQKAVDCGVDRHQEEDGGGEGT